MSRLCDGLITPEWPAPAMVNAVVTTRAGGVSEPPYERLNLATHVGDRPDAVAENRRLLVSEAGLPAEPLWLEQVHGVEVWNAAESPADLPASAPPRADAVFSSLPGRVCAVMTADCLPVLFCDADGEWVAAAHAGWRGLQQGVLEATVAAYPGRATQLMAWLGPAIGPAAFEVGADVRDAFVTTDRDAAVAFHASSSSGHYLADIYRLATQRLNRVGVTNVYGGQFCTFADASRFYSYRRDGDCGRMASLIWFDESS